MVDGGLCRVMTVNADGPFEAPSTNHSPTVKPNRKVVRKWHANGRANL
jgi:hypothetical protein